MKKGWFNSMLSKSKKEFEHRCGLSKSMDSLGPIENISQKEDTSLTDNDSHLTRKENSNNLDGTQK